MYYHQGNGVRDTYFWLGESGVFRNYFICDICPGDEALGLFEIHNDTLLLDYRLRFIYNPHWARINDTVFETNTWRDTMYYVKHENNYYLCTSVPEFKKVVNLCGNSHCELERYFLKQVPRKD